MRCEDCQGKLFHDSESVWTAWHSLMCAVQTLNSEGTITDNTMDLMVSDLLKLKHLVSEEAEREQKRG